MPEVIELRPFYHRNGEQMGLWFTSLSLQQHIKLIPKIRYSRTHQIWYLPLSKSSYELILKVLSGIARIIHSELKDYLHQRRLQLVVNSSTGLSKARAEQCNACKQ